MKKFLRLLFAVGFLFITSVLYSQNNYKNTDSWGDATYWKDNAANGNWNADNWYNATQGWDNHNPNYEGGRNLIFDNNNQTTMTNDFSGSGVGRWQINFTPNATSERTISGVTENIFYDNGGTKPKIENLSATNHTIAFPIKFGYNPMELNPVNGNLTISSNIDNNGNYIDVYGPNSKVLTLSGNISGTGGISIKQNSRVVLSINAKAYTGATVLEAGILELSVNLASTITVKSSASLIINGEVSIPGLTIESGGMVTINPGKSLTVSGTLTNDAGTDGLVIASDASGTGSLICSNSANATVQRYLTQDYYHYIASPVAAQVISPEFINTGETVASQSAVDLFKFDEITNTWDNIKNGAAWDDNFEDNFGIAKGYVYAYRTSNITKNFTGLLNVADQTINLTVTPSEGNGWNLVGNPFASTLAANSGAQATNNLVDANSSLYESGYAALYFWKEQPGYSGTSRVAEYEVINNLSGEQYVNPGQAFMIKAKTHNTNYDFKANMRKHGTSAFYKSTSSDDYGRFYLTITDPEDDYNETLIGFVPEATDGLDEGFDAIKLKGNPNIALYSKLINGDDGDFAIQALPSFTGNEVITISLDANKTGTYIFKAGHRENLDNISIKLEDRLTGIFTTLEGSAQYSFTVLTAGKIENRFFLHFKSSVGIEDPATTEKTIYSWGNTIYFETSGNATLDIFNITGQKIESRQINSGGSQTLSLHAPTGWYIVKLVTSLGVKSEKIFIN